MSLLKIKSKNKFGKYVVTSENSGYYNIDALEVIEFVVEWIKDQEKKE